MIIDCISDLHGFYPKLEGGDLLIVAGDLTKRDDPEEYIYFRLWLSNQDYKKRIVVAGNHDNELQLDNTFGSTPFLEIADYLCDSWTQFEGLKIWGSPWTTSFPGMNRKCKAFTVRTEEELRKKFEIIPSSIDILVTHSPPYGIYDKTLRGELVGSKSLLIKVAEVKPMIHCFGHIHEEGGKELYLPWKNGTRFINCSYVNEYYKPVHKAMRVIL